jgi:hypothetical protein
MLGRKSLLLVAELFEYTCNAQCHGPMGLRLECYEVLSFEKKLQFLTWGCERGCR